jgi:DNA-binding CsgD family transcriptional regulator
MIHAHDRVLQQIDRVCREARTARDLMRDAGGMLAEATNADSFVMMRFDPQSALAVEAYEGGDPQQRCTAFAERAYFRGRFGDFAALAQGSQRIFTVDESLAEDPYVEHVMRPFGYRQELLVNLAHDQQPFGQLFLSRQTSAFDPRVHSVVEGSLASVTQGLRRLLAEETLQAIPGGSVALFFVDTQGALTPASEHAHELMRIYARHTTDPINSPLRFMAQMIGRELRGELKQPLPSSIIVDPERHQRYRIVAERMLEDAITPRAMLVVEPLRAIDSVDLLRHAGLTEREAEVALATLRGLTSARGALSLRISEHTFLSHLKNVYRKLGVGSRSELAALLLGANHLFDRGGASASHA